ncbi:Uncharacterised protein [Klebsiella pneumoniae]|nr:Uncharacterised protein [Klebsiella pneumoniae]
MAFCRQVHHDIRTEIAELLRDGFSIGDIRLSKGVTFAIGNRRQRFKIPRISQAIHHAYFVLGIFNNMTYNCRTNKTRAASDKDLHI